MDEKFPESFFGIFLPSANFDRREFLANFWNRDYWMGDKDTIMQNYFRIVFYFRLTDLEHGYLGFTPRLSLPGDIIAILNGFDVPVVLQKHEDHYILIGSCFVPGLMKWEAKYLLDSGRARVEEVQIR
jgi:hypothetical protein